MVKDCCGEANDDTCTAVLRQFVTEPNNDESPDHCVDQVLTELSTDLVETDLVELPNTLVGLELELQVGERFSFVRDVTQRKCCYEGSENPDENLLECGTTNCRKYFHNICNSDHVVSSAVNGQNTEDYGDRCEECRTTCAYCKKDFCDWAKIVDCQLCTYLVHDGCARVLNIYQNYSEVDYGVDPEKPICRNCLGGPNSPIQKIKEKLA